MYMKHRNISIHELKRMPRQGNGVPKLVIPTTAYFDALLANSSLTLIQFKQQQLAVNNLMNEFDSIIESQTKTLGVSSKTLADYAINFRTAVADGSAMDGHLKLLQNTQIAMDDVNKSLKESKAATKFASDNSVMAKEVEALIHSNTYLERRNASLNKSFGVTSRASANLAERFVNVSAALNGTMNTMVDGKTITTGLANQYAINSQQVTKYAESLQNLIPLLDQSKEGDPKYATGMKSQVKDKDGKDKQNNNEYIDGLYKAQHILETSLGLSAEQSQNFQMMATYSDTSAISQLAAFDEMAKGFDPNGTAGVFKGIISEIATLTQDISIHYGKQPIQLGKSIMKMKQLGLSMTHLYEAGEKMLDIESSIEKELSYQLITGNQLVDAQGESLTNKFREAHLSGKSVEAAEAMSEIINKEAATLNTSLFARKEMSELLGISEQQIASALAKKEILDAAAKNGVAIKLDGSEQNMKAAAKMLEAGDISAAAFETLINDQDQRSTTDIAKESLTALQELVLLNSGVLKDQSAKVTNNRAIGLDASTNIKNVLSDKILEYTKSMQDEYNATKSLERAAEIRQQGAGTGTGALVLGNDEQPQDKLDSLKDAIIPPGFGSRVLSFPEDKLQPSIAFNDTDTITASTQEPTFASTMPTTIASTMPPTPETDTSNSMLLIADVLNKILSKSSTTTTTTPKAAADSGQYIMQVGKMIVAALQNQTGQLKPRPIDNTFGPGLNKPLYSDTL